MKLGPIFSSFTLLSLLTLTACGAQDGDTSASSSTASTSASSSSASSLASGPAQSGTGASSSAAAGSASGYQPATEKGPAQNVPRPQAPEGMDVESVEGLEKFLNYWFQMRDYAVQTGDTTELYRLIETSAENEQKFLSATNTYYGSNGWIAYDNGNPQMILETSGVETNGEGLYSIKAKFSTPVATAYNSDGSVSEKLDTSEANKRNSTIIARYTKGKWSLVNIEVTE